MSVEMENLIGFIKANIHASKEELKELNEYGPTCTVNESKISEVLSVIETYEGILEFIGEES